MRASIPNTEQLEMSENNDIKEEKRQSMRLAMWKYLRRQDTEKHTGHWNRGEAKRKSVVWKTDTFSTRRGRK